MIVSGDSFTASDYQSIHYPKINCDWAGWPELVADELDMECINLARSGSGNEYIYSSLLDEVNKHKIEDIGFVFAGWTQAGRMDWTIKDYWKSDHVISSFLQNTMPGGDEQHQIKKTLRYQYSFQQVMKSLALPFAHIQMVRLVRETPNSIPQHLRNMPIANHNFKFEKTFIDYTRHYKWGAESEIVPNTPNDKYRIGKDDGHFNGEGHKLFAEYILKKFENWEK